jgi:predicted dehydrogenase
MNTMNRRDVLKASGLGAVALLTPSARAQEAAEDRLRIGVVGVGGRGGANLGGVRRENIVALCDINPANLARARERYSDARACTDWRELVVRDDIDAVVVSTPDHHHALVSLAAMQANKHVYCEKPLAHTVLEARLMQEAYIAKRGRVATQMGTQIHASGNFRRVVELIQSGAIGPIREAHVWCNRGMAPIDEVVLEAQPVPTDFDWDVWLGPAAERAYNEGYWRGGCTRWERRWDFGNGVLGDMGSHLIDLPFWALQLRDPIEIRSEGPEPDAVRCPTWQEITWDHPAREANEFLNVPCRLKWYHGVEGMRRRATYLQPRVGKDTDINDWAIGVAFIGDGGVLVADYRKHLLSPVSQFADFTPPEPSIPDSLGHYAEWIHAAKTGGESLCNFDYSGKLIENNLLGNVAHRVGRPLRWNASEFTVENDAAATALLTKSYREGWDVHQWAR